MSPLTLPQVDLSAASEAVSVSVTLLAVIFLPEVWNQLTPVSETFLPAAVMLLSTETFPPAVAVRSPVVSISPATVISLDALAVTAWANLPIRLMSPVSDAVLTTEIEPPPTESTTKAPATMSIGAFWV